MSPWIRSHKFPKLFQHSVPALSGKGLKDFIPNLNISTGSIAPELQVE